MHCRGNKCVRWALASEEMVINSSSWRQSQQAASESQEEPQIKDTSLDAASLAAEGLGFMPLLRMNRGGSRYKRGEPSLYLLSGNKVLPSFMNEGAGWSQHLTSKPWPVFRGERPISYCLVSAKQPCISEGKLRSFCMCLLTWCLSAIPISANGVIGSPQCELPIMHPHNLISECKSY